ncbi:MAG: DegT/DnrJ/EryC1/StrS family aminotransferase, partial [Oscillospiraceae bacterium]|nr:DegT/DnrJ/EryC1/StrS family aminotransferase [Oscillospiraceae bacterium]
MNNENTGIPAICGGSPVRSKKLYYSHQDVNEKDIQAVVDVLKSDYLTTGPAITDMEEKLCKVTGAKHAVAISNDTAALHVAC